MDDDPTVVPLVPVPGRFGDAIRAGAGVPVEEPELAGFGRACWPSGTICRRGFGW